MPIDHTCPGCQQPLQVPEDYLGRAVACPSCKHIFRIGPAPAPAPPLPPPPPARDDHPRRHGRNDDDYEDDRPRRRGGYAEAEDRRHWRGRADSAHTMGLLSCILFWLVPIGFILGVIAYMTASSDLARMQEERSGDSSTRVRFESAKNLGLIGLVLGAVLFVACCGFNFSMARMRL